MISLLRKNKDLQMQLGVDVSSYNYVKNIHNELRLLIYYDFGLCNSTLCSILTLFMYYYWNFYYCHLK